MPRQEPKTAGQLISILLQERGWDQKTLAAVLGVKSASISHLVTGRTRIDAATAIALSQAFNCLPERFMQLQQAHDLDQARLSMMPLDDLKDRAALFGQLPIAEMISRGWLRVDNPLDFDSVKTEAAKFFGVESLSAVEIVPHAAKKTAATREASPTELAWIQRVKQITWSQVLPQFTPRAIPELVDKLGSLLYSAEEVRMVPRILTEAGIRFAIVEPLKSSRIDGVTFWLGDKTPVIALSMRFDRIDNFWFVLRHELEHVSRGHGKNEMVVDSNLDEAIGSGASLPPQERDANAAAADFCVPTKLIDSFIARKDPIFTENDLLGFSRIHRIHPGIVAGQIHQKTQRFDLFRKHLSKVRSIVTSSAMVDGWGTIAPTWT